MGTSKKAKAPHPKARTPIAEGKSLQRGALGSYRDSQVAKPGRKDSHESSKKQAFTDFHSHHRTHRPISLARSGRSLPCEPCAVKAPEHVPQGSPCQVRTRSGALCNLEETQHRKPRERPGRHTTKAEQPWVGLDGEGKTVNGRHLYISLCYSNSTGHKADEIVNEEGLSTEECLNFILSIPEDVKIAGFALGYDWTKILEDMPTKLIYELTHPNLRRHPKTNRPSPVRWKHYRLNLIATKLTVQSGVRRRAIHDIFKFFGTAFVPTLEKWDVGTVQIRTEMQAMKDERSRFDRQNIEKICAYSRGETRSMAELAEKLVEAHNDVGLPLTMFFGAGSTAATMLKEMRIDEEIVPLPKEVMSAARYAFFGGRFELSRLGEIQGPIYDFDINSAYPYQIWNLPCLKCGRWTWSKDEDRAKIASMALIRYGFASWSQALPSWGPFPYRDSDGSIPFPITSSGGWVYRDEFFAGKRLFPHVRFVGAWVYETRCQHRPFARIPKWYLARCELGSDGRGYVIKLGLNSIYGKLAQTVGSRRYHQLVWAGLVTSGTRAQLLDMLGLHEKWSDVLMMATDGVWSLRKVSPPPPCDTGTFKVKKALGTWGVEERPEGVFMARPGIYWLLGDNQDYAKEAKARGIGTRDLWRNRAAIRSHYEKHQGREPFVFDPKELAPDGKPMLAPRFVGMRSGISVSRNRSAHFGLWHSAKRVLSFDPAPKRADWAMRLRRMPMNETSAPYTKGMPEKDNVKENEITAETLSGYLDDSALDQADRV